MAVIFLPRLATARGRHELIRFPSTNTVQASHYPWSQPFLEPVNPIRSRRRPAESRAGQWSRGGRSVPSGRARAKAAARVAARNKRRGSPPLRSRRLLIERRLSSPASRASARGPSPADAARLQRMTPSASTTNKACRPATPYILRGVPKLCLWLYRLECRESGCIKHPAGKGRRPPGGRRSE